MSTRRPHVRVRGEIGDLRRPVLAVERKVDEHRLAFERTQDLRFFRPQIARGRSRLECADGHDPRAVPEPIENRRSPTRHGTRAEHVEIAEVEVLAEAEVLVADVAPAEDHGAIVGHQHLVVHAPVHEIHATQEVDAPAQQRARVKRVEQPQLDVRMRAENGRLPVANLECAVVLEQRAEVVEDDAHSHAAIGRVDHVLHEQLAGVVFPPEVILKVDGMLGRVDQREAPAQRIFIGVEQAPRGNVSAEVQTVFEAGERTAGLWRKGEACCSARQMVGERGATHESEDQQQRN